MLLVNVQTKRENRVFIVSLLSTAFQLPMETRPAMGKMQGSNGENLAISDGSVPQMYIFCIYVHM